MIINKEDKLTRNIYIYITLMSLETLPLKGLIQTRISLFIVHFIYSSAFVQNKFHVNFQDKVISNFLNIWSIPNSQKLKDMQKYIKVYKWTSEIICVINIYVTGTTLTFTPLKSDANNTIIQSIYRVKHIKCKT